jgi:hypothetical protein
MVFGREWSITGHCASCDFRIGAIKGMEVKLPNFLIVGAPKSGTTSLYRYLQQHPEVFMPQHKESRFFASSFYRNNDPHDPLQKFLTERTIFTFEDYVKLFEGAEREKAIGEATPTYLYLYEIVIPQIRKFLRNVKIIAILRDPVDRAFSAHTHLLKNQSEVLSFERCLELEEERKAANWAPMNFYKSVGLYYNQVKAFMENFDEVKVVLYDDLAQDALGLMRDLYEFLEVDPSFVPNVSTAYAVTGVPRDRSFYEFLNFLTRSNALKSMVRVALPGKIRTKLRKNLEALKVETLVKPEMKPETREYLKSAFREDILELQGLLDRDLGHWLN